MSYRRLVAALGALAALVGACANPPTTTEAEAVADEASTTAETTADETATAAETPSGPHAHLARALAGEFDGSEVAIMGQWIDADEDSFVGTLAGFEDATGIDIVYDGVSDYTTVLNVRVEGGDAPDLAQIAQPGLVESFASKGQLVNLSDYINVDQLASDYSEAWMDLGTVDGDVYGVAFRASTKSLVWYPVAGFEANGYTVPETWDELTALSQQIVDDGNGAPWCISHEQDDATGWVTTDWIEDVLLRTAPLDVYDQWAANEIAFDAPEVVAATEQVGEVFFTDGWAYGGPTYINTTWVGDTQQPMFAEEGPECWMHKQAGWISDFWPKDAETEEPLFTPGEDVGAFYFPPIDDDYGRPVLGAGDLFVQFDDRPEVRAVMEYLATPDAAKGWIEAGGFTSPNSAVPPEWYGDYTSQKVAEILAAATALRVDASDSMPPEIGAGGGAFFTGMIDWVSAEGANTEEILAGIDAKWPSGG